MTIGTAIEHRGIGGPGGFGGGYRGVEPLSPLPPAVMGEGRGYRGVEPASPLPPAGKMYVDGMEFNMVPKMGVSGQMDEKRGEDVSFDGVGRAK